MKKMKKSKESPLSRKEKKLAFLLLLPTVFLVLSIVLFPLIANFWISFKPIQLGDLRPPRLILKERVRGKLTSSKDTAEIHYKYRNSSQKYALKDVFFTDLIPKGMNIESIESEKKCSVKFKKLTCQLENLGPGSSGNIILVVSKKNIKNII